MIRARLAASLSLSAMIILSSWIGVASEANAAPSLSTAYCQPGSLCVVNDPRPEPGIPPAGLTNRYASYGPGQLTPMRCENASAEIMSFNQGFPRGIHSAINNSPYYILFYRGPACVAIQQGSAVGGSQAPVVNSW
jgi:hypothetical protein